MHQPFQSTSIIYSLCYFPFIQSLNIYDPIPHQPRVLIMQPYDGYIYVQIIYTSYSQSVY